MMTPILLQAFYALLMIGAVMSLAAYCVLAERKVSAWIQGRLGPNRTVLPWVGSIPFVGTFLRRGGFFQPLADALKFLFKEEPSPGHVKTFYYWLAPVVSIVPALLTMVVIPFGQYTNPETGMTRPLLLASVDIGLLFLFAVSSLGVYGTVLAGWSSNSKYPFFGSIRSGAQLISYELVMGLSVLPLIIWANEPSSSAGLNLTGIVSAQNGLWFILWQPLSAMLFLIALFAETNRLPFDMPESETELVGGFHTEYGSFKFGFFFLAEYAHMTIGSALFTLLFLGGWNFLPGIANPWPMGALGAILSVLWFLIKVCTLLFVFIWVRWTIPRFRYDQVMKMAWGKLIPLGLANLIVYALVIAWLSLP
jgi:NADH-quinone oxidoreductase subunit H